MQIKKIFFTLFFITIVATNDTRQKDKTHFILVLDPAGDTKKTGRSIDDCFERGLTLQFAEKIKIKLEQLYPHIKVIITRLPGDIVYELQNASLANRINADLFVSLNFYQTTDAKPTLSLYQFSYGADFASHQSQLSLNTYDQAYIINKDLTNALTKTFTTTLQNACKHMYTIAGPYALPIKPLIGIVAPSIALEIGLKNKDAWELLIDPLVCALHTALAKSEN